MSVRKLLNPMNVGIVTLIVGLMLGYQVNDVLSSRKIDDLQGTIDEQSATISSLEHQVAVLNENYTEVREDLGQVREAYEVLQNNAVMRSVYDDLLEDYTEATEELLYATERVSKLEEEVSDLRDEYEELQDSYFKLWNEYNKIRVLSWTYFIVEGLEVNFTTTKLKYELNSDVKGTIQIYHVGGEPFNGSFELRAWSEYLNVGTISGEKQVYGETEYTFVNPFKFGGGSYFLRVSSIKDAEGNVIASANQLKDYSINVQVG